MGMVVRTNIMAMNANRQLGMNNNQVSKSLEKLSSGFRINRAGDDAAGLAISEKMKAQIKGLEQASSNSQDGISLVQTAEGALTEVHSMLNRMVELATKSANGTIQNEVDRDAIQSEVNALLEEIDRIGDSTNFNGINLLDGALSGINISTTPGAAASGGAAYMNNMTVVAGSGAGAANGDTIAIVYNDGTGAKTLTMTVAAAADHENGDITAAELEAANAGGDALNALINTLAAAGNTTAQNFLDTFTVTAGSATQFQVTAKAEDADVAMTSITVSVAAGGVTEGTYALGTGTNAVAGVDPTEAATGASTTLDFTGKTGKNMVGKTIKYGETTFEFVKNAADVKAGNTAIVIADDDADTDIATAVQAAMDISYQTDGANNDTVVVAANAAGDNTLVTITNGSTGVASVAPTATMNSGLTLQVGDTGDAFNMVTVSVDDMRSAGLGVAGLDVSNADAARAAIKTIKDAINVVSTNRANLGALQNRLEYTINNLDVASENMTAANSRIRDTDMAKEMMEYTKTNVLTQAAQAMLAQANQQPQSILQLLQ